jgi:hypothetical protein
MGRRVHVPDWIRKINFGQEINKGSVQGAAKDEIKEVDCHEGKNNVVVGPPWPSQAMVTDTM